jgi:hypothetical protein
MAATWHIAGACRTAGDAATKGCAGTRPQQI